MDGLKGITWLLAAALAGVVVVVGSRSFLGYQPAVPGSANRSDIETDSEPSESNRRSRSDNSGSALVVDRVARLQAVIRRQRTELAALRGSSPKPKVRPKNEATKEHGAGTSLLSRLSNLNLSGLSSETTNEVSKEELTSQLLELRDITLSLQDDLEAAESVVEMQSAEIEDLTDEIDTTRERLATLAEESEGLDAAIEDMLSEAKDIEQAARNTLRALGPSAAAMLLTFVDDDRAHVRNWIRNIVEQISRDNEDEP